MTGRSRLLYIILAVLLLAVTLVASGCTDRQSTLTKMSNGGYKLTEGDNVWVWERSGSTERITLNDMLLTVIQHNRAQFTLANGQKLDVTMDNTGAAVSARISWGTQLGQAEYAMMNKAFSVRDMALQEAGGGQAGSLGWVIVLLIVVIAGVLLFLYADRLVNSWKLGGIFSGHDTAKSLLVFKALGVVLIVIGGAILLVVIF